MENTEESPAQYFEVASIVPLFILDNPISYLSWLLRGPTRATCHGSSVTTGGNQSTSRKPAMLGRVKLDDTLLTCDQGNFNQITARSRNGILVTLVRHVHHHCGTSTPCIAVPINAGSNSLRYCTFTNT